MGVEIFKTARAYKEWANSMQTKNIEIVSVVVFDDEIIVTWKYV